MTKRIFQYLIITFAITYLFWGMDILLSIFGLYEHPSYNIGMIFYIIAASSPATSVYTLMQLDPDKKGIRHFLKMSFTFNKPFSEILLVCVFTGIRFIIPFLFNEVSITGHLWQVVVYTPVMLLFGGLEEIGWRGFLQTKLEDKFGALTSTLIICAIWVVWHIPLCFIKGTYQYSGSYFWFAVSLIGSAFSLAAIHSVGKNILPCIVYHSVGNSIVSYGISISDGLGMAVSVCIQIIFAVVILILCNSTKRTRAFKF